MFLWRLIIERKAKRVMKRDVGIAKWIDMGAKDISRIKDEKGKRA